MDNQIIVEKLEDLKLEIKNKKCRLFFFVADTLGKPMASIEYIYRLGLQMSKEGYVVYMLHEKDKYVGVRDWLGADYGNLPHLSLSDMNNSDKFQIRGSDFFFVSELYADFIKKLHESKLPSETVVVCQSHTFIFKHLNAGDNWRYSGVENVITTSAKMVSFLEEYQPVQNIHVINPVISKDFKPSEKPQKPIISIISRNPDDIERVAKLFYQKYPMYSWITFKTLGNLIKSQFAESLSETCLAIWLDDVSTFGTFPLECMASGVPVIIKIPDLIPEWAEKQTEDKLLLADNAIYVSNILAIPDYIGRFVESWLLDDVPQTLYDSMKNVATPYSEENASEQTHNVFQKIFESKINKITQTQEKYK